MPQVRTRVRRPAPVSDTLQQLGERIRRARVDSGLSQAQLGAPHFTRAYVSAVELGKVRPAMKSLEFMAGKLGKPVSFFMEDEDTARRRLERDAVAAHAKQLVSEGKAAEAIELLLPQIAETSISSQRARLQRLLGRAYTQARRGPEAVDVLTRALLTFESVDDPEQIARTRAQLGAALIEVPSYGEAESALERALEELSRAVVKDPLLRVHILYNLGVTFYMRGDYRAAAQQFQRAEREGADIGDDRWQAGLLAGMGMSYLALADYEAAVMYFRRSEALFEGIRNKVRAVESRFRLGQSLRAMGQNSKAIELVRSALADARVFRDKALATRISAFHAVQLADVGELDEAIREAAGAQAAADSLNDPVLRVESRVSVAKALAKRDPKKAERVLRDAAALAERTNVGYSFADVYQELSDVLAHNGMAEEALSYSRKAFEVARRGSGR